MNVTRLSWRWINLFLTIYITIWLKYCFAETLPRNLSNSVCLLSFMSLRKLTLRMETFPTKTTCQNFKERFWALDRIDVRTTNTTQTFCLSVQRTMVVRVEDWDIVWLMISYCQVRWLLSMWRELDTVLFNVSSIMMAVSELISF